MRKIFAIIFLVMAGFFAYSVCILAFADVGVVKYVMIFVFSIPIFLLSLFGVKIDKTRSLSRTLGLVFMGGAISAAFVVLTFVCMLASPDVQKMFAAESIALFSNYAVGAAVTTLFFILGCGLQGRRAQ